jgi:hypothetical protein
MLIVAFGMYSIPLSEDALKSIVGDNPEMVMLHAESRLFKERKVTVEVPTKLLDVGNLRLNVTVPQSWLMKEKHGKLLSCGFERKRTGVLGSSSLFSKWTTITFYA